jgi:hypothetical protein
MKFAKWVFRIAGIYGVIVITPLFFLESQVGRDNPAGITHPEFYYGFICVTLAAQFMFLVIATDPVHYRPLMVVGMWEKFSYGVACVVLLMNHRVPSSVGFFCLVDVVLGVLFVAAWFRTAETKSRLL